MTVPDSHHRVVTRVASPVFELESELGDGTPKDLVDLDEYGPAKFDRREAVVSIWENGGTACSDMQ